MAIKMPEILNIPPKLYDFIFKFNDYTYFLLEGGRASGKTQSVARFLLYICENRRVRICCGREIQNSIAESVKTVFLDLIEKYNLNYEIKGDSLTHNKTKSTIFFKGFREQGKVNIKGLEGIDILWIDEAQSITKATLDVIVPTVRKKNSTIIFTMNRQTRFDAVYQFCSKNPSSLNIHCNYLDNPFCEKKVLDDAQYCKKSNLSDYNHVWLGQPKEQGSNYLIASSIIDKAINLSWSNERHDGHSILSVDLSGAGGDLTVAKSIVQRSNSVWEEAETFSWSEADTDITRGKIINLYSELKPDVLVVDADGLGYPIYCSLRNSLGNVYEFRGAGASKRKGSGNARADGYFALKEMLENEFLKLNCSNTIRQLEYMQTKWQPNSGRMFILDKKEIRKIQGESPDFADALMMGVYVLNYCPGYFCKSGDDEGYYLLDTDYDL